MDWKQSLKPTKRKVITFLVVLVFWYILISFDYLTIICSCMFIKSNACVDYQYLSPFPTGCNCGCTSISEIIQQYILLFSLPAIVYLIYSITQFFKSK